MTSESRVIVLAILILAVGFAYTVIEERAHPSGYAAKNLEYAPFPEYEALPQEQKAPTGAPQNIEPEGTNLEQPLSENEVRTIVQRNLARPIDCTQLPKELHLPSVMVACKTLSRGVSS